MATKSKGKKFKGPLYTFLMIVSFVILIAMLLQWKPVTDQVSKWTGIASDKIKSTAQTVVGLGLGIALVTWGIAALSVPILGGAMIVVGLVLLAYSLWPLFKPNPAAAQSASFDAKGPLKIFGTIFGT